MTKKEAMLTASKYNLQGEVAYLVDKQSLTPEEALSELDIL